MTCMITIDESALSASIDADGNIIRVDVAGDVSVCDALEVSLQGGGTARARSLVVAPDAAGRWIASFVHGRGCDLAGLIHTEAVTVRVTCTEAHDGASCSATAPLRVARPSAAAAIATHESDRSTGSLHRSPEQVLASHFANLAAGDYEAEHDIYAADAVVVSDQGVTRGVDAIVASLAGFGTFFGGRVPVVNERIVVSILNEGTYMVRTLFSISTPGVDINDGTDTYIIRDGRIQAQTAHGVPTFKGGQPPRP